MTALAHGLYLWRSSHGVTVDGALVCARVPRLGISDCAALMVRVGPVSAMELDINTASHELSVLQ
jgi:hypothetical protein